MEGACKTRDMPDQHSQRVGITSRVRAGRGPKSHWTAPNGQVVELPLTVDIRDQDASGTIKWQVDALVGLVDGEPALLEMRVRSAEGLDVGGLQEHFRWVTPLLIVTVTVPELLSMGIDPLTYAYPVGGFPDAAHITRAVPTRLTDAFLTEIAVRYRVIGRGYARTIAAERNVSQRTVVSWIEKARARGILSETTAGRMGGEVRPGMRPQSTRHDHPARRSVER